MWERAVARSLNSTSTISSPSQQWSAVVINHRETEVNIVSIYYTIHSRDILHSTEVSGYTFINRSSTIYFEIAWVTILFTQDRASFSQDFSWDFQVFFPPFFSVVVSAFLFLSFFSAFFCFFALWYTFYLFFLSFLRRVFDNFFNFMRENRAYHFLTYL